MSHSCRCIIHGLHHKGYITDAEYEKLLRNVEQREKGKWIEDPDENFASTYHCSNCGVSPVVDNYEQYVFSDFCPFCGADMRGEGNE